MIEQKSCKFAKNGEISICHCSLFEEHETTSRRIKEKKDLDFSRPIFIDKNKIFLDHLIDQCGGSYFELKEKHLCKLDTNQAKGLVQTGADLCSFE